MATIVDPPIETSVKHFVKSIHGVEIWLRPADGMFTAKFSQSAEPKEFERKTLTELEVLITQHVLPYSGHVAITRRPENPISQRDVDTLRENNGERYSKRERVRTPMVVTGVQRREGHSIYKQGTTIYFRLGDEGRNVYPIDGGEKIVHPSADLDTELFETALRYVESMQYWHDAFQSIIDRYEPFMLENIVAELRAQGAKAPRY